MKVVAVGGPIHEQEIEMPDNWPITMPWSVAERPRSRFGVLDMPLTQVSLALDSPVIHRYYLAVLARTERLYLYHDPKTCHCRIGA